MSDFVICWALGWPIGGLLVTGCFRSLLLPHSLGPPPLHFPWASSLSMPRPGAWEMHADVA